VAIKLVHSAMSISRRNLIRNGLLGAAVVLRPGFDGGGAGLSGDGRAGVMPGVA
jgi:hypothetical protein